MSTRTSWLRRWNLDRLVRWMVSLQVLLATLLLSMGEHSALLPLATLVLLIVSAYVVDVRKWFHLNQPLADCLALLVVAVSAASAYRADRSALLVSVASLQSYLQYVLLFQPQSPRIFWQLALLSLGQVAIASTLVPGPAFGILLLAYLLAGLVSFSLLLLYRESNRVAVATVATTTGGRALSLTGGSAPVEPLALVRGLLGPAALVTTISVALGVLMFFSLPRWNVDSLEANTGEPLRTVGFSKTVTLGDLGEVINNSDLVMRVQFFRGRSSRPMKLAGEPLFRGTVVSVYENRTWTQSRLSSPVILSDEPNSTLVRQRITVEPLDVNELFCIFPVFASERPDQRLRVDATSNQLMRLEECREQQIDFEVATTGIVGNRQRQLVPCDARPNQREMPLMRAFPPADENDPFAGLRALAAQILSDAQIDPEQDPAAAARALSDYFSRSGRFFYSLEPQARDPNLDPLEDFVTQHRLGHCEYFAGALVLMLRSVGIPARMAIGFKGGEWNPLGMYYQVQQLHAHSWVEVYLSRNQVPADQFSEDEADLGAWLLLDPTEGTQEGDAGLRNTGFLARVRQSLDYARVLWINYFASLTAKRQREGIFEPLMAGMDAAVDNLTSQQGWQARMDAVNESSLGRFWRWYRRHWFSWRGGLVAVAFCFLAVGVVLGVRVLVRRLLARGWLGGRAKAEEPQVLVMYRRLEAALGRFGLARQPAQTPYEFALAAGGELAERVEHRRLAHLPRRIVESFYRVRFGGRTLDNQEAQAVEHALEELELALIRPR